MSVAAMSFVWKLDLPHDEKFVLLAYADNANDNGGNIFPALLTVAKKTGYSKRNVQYITEKLEKRGLLVRCGKSRHATTMWRIDMDWMAKTAIAKIATVQSETNEVAKIATPSMLQIATEPSLTIKEPSIGGLTQKELGQANAKVDAVLEGMRKVKYPNRDKIPEPYLVFADTYNELTDQRPTKNVLSDWLMTFSEWADEGFQPEHIREAYKYATRADGGFMVGRPGALTNTIRGMKSKMRVAITPSTPESRMSRILAEIGATGG